ncbi:MAG: hypothetical protein EA422_14310 [Gemmatimonadales bacterium]|nr:MAG: hypothetical protein EA422_14310 [Gemmatimonadales bacterium]
MRPVHGEGRLVRPSRSAGAPRRQSPVGLFLVLAVSILFPAVGISAQQAPAGHVLTGSDALLTRAERTGTDLITPPDEISAFFHALAAAAPETVRLREIGESREGRPLELVVLARPGIAEPWEAHASGKPIFFIGAQVHGNEPAGGEGLMRFAREVVLGELAPFLDHMVFILVPVISPDGSAAAPWGTRENRAGYNLNRDYTRLTNPESSAVVQEVLTPWRPHVMVDLHELTGPRVYDFYALHPSNLNVDATLRALAAGPASLAIQQALEEGGFTYFPYHIQPSDPTQVAEEGIVSGGYGLRILRNYGGARGAVSILFESRRETDPSIDLVSRGHQQKLGLEGMARWVAAEGGDIVAAVEGARLRMQERGAQWNPADSVVVTAEFVSSGLVDYRMPEFRPRADGTGMEPTGEILDLRIPFADSAVSTLSRVRPVGYLIEPHRGDLVRELRRHGIQVERIAAPVRMEVEHFRVESVEYAAAASEGYVERQVRASLEEGEVDLPLGAYLVRSGQPLAPLVFALLEPEDMDSFASVGAFSAEKRVGGVLPVHRLRRLPEGVTPVLP